MKDVHSRYVVRESAVSFTRKILGVVKGGGGGGLRHCDIFPRGAEELGGKYNLWVYVVAYDRNGFFSCLSKVI